MPHRRSATPPEGDPQPAVHATRRAGARKEIAQRIALRRGSSEFEAWTLNVSRGGIRLIVEERLDPNEAVEVCLGTGPDRPPVRRPGRVVWVQEEPDGDVVGIEFLDSEDEAPTGETPP